MNPLIYVLITIIGTVTGQLLLKKGMLEVGQIPAQVEQYIHFFVKALSNMRVISSLVLAGVAAMAWIAALSKLKLSYAYPFMASTFAFVLFFSAIIFKEHVPMIRWIGVSLIWVGVFLISRG